MGGSGYNLWVPIDEKQAIQLLRNGDLSGSEFLVETSTIAEERVELANRKLEKYGIVFEYVNGDVNILQQPKDMSDWDAYPVAWDVLADWYGGPWTFTVDINP